MVDSISSNTFRTEERSLAGIQLQTAAKETVEKARNENKIQTKEDFPEPSAVQVTLERTFEKKTYESQQEARRINDAITEIQNLKQRIAEVEQRVSTQEANNRQENLQDLAQSADDFIARTKDYVQDRADIIEEGVENIEDTRIAQEISQIRTAEEFEVKQDNKVETSTQDINPNFEVIKSELDRIEKAITETINTKTTINREEAEVKTQEVVREFKNEPENAVAVQANRLGGNQVLNLLTS